jgi:hypothetical protein
MKVIFLDIDGVLNSTAFLTRQHEAGIELPWPECHLDTAAVSVLNEIVAMTGAVVVVSSTWRIGVSIVWLQETLNKAGFKGLVLDKTVRLNKVARGLEIQEWLDTHKLAPGETMSYVILDDDTDMEHLYPKLVHIDDHEGLTDKYLPQIFEHLWLKDSYENPER